MHHTKENHVKAAQQAKELNAYLTIEEMQVEGITCKQAEKLQCHS